MPRGIYDHSFLRKDITGQKFGRLTAIKIVGYYKKGRTYIWLFQCSCGKKTKAHIGAVTTGSTVSCGCWQRELAGINVRKYGGYKTHGLSRSRIYKIYRSMQDRCTNPNDQAFRYYGGRGIKCLWQSFEQFRDDMHESYLAHVKEFGERQTTIDRIDNNGNYCKENCRWATMKEQCNNRRSNVLIEFRGRTQNMKQWAEEIGISHKLLWDRIRKAKWSIEKSLTQKPRFQWNGTWKGIIETKPPASIRGSRRG